LFGSDSATDTELITCPSAILTEWEQVCQPIWQVIEMATMISKVGLGEELFERYRCSVTELAEQVQNHLGKVTLPDLNLDNLKALLARG